MCVCFAAFYRRHKMIIVHKLLVLKELLYLQQFKLRLSHLSCHKFRPMTLWLRNICHLHQRGSDQYLSQNRGLLNDFLGHQRTPLQPEVVRGQ